MADKPLLPKHVIESELRSLDALAESDDRSELDRPLGSARRHEIEGERRALRFALDQDQKDVPGSLTERHMGQTQRSDKELPF